MFQQALQLNGGSTPFQFSETEQKTNLKWIDGKPIYTITTAITDFTTKALNISNVDKIVGADGVFDHIGTNGMKYGASPYYTDTNDYWNFYYSYDGVSITTRGKTASVSREFYITLFYTKTTD